MSQLVVLGLAARNILQEQKFHIPKVDKEIVNEYFIFFSNFSFLFYQKKIKIKIKIKILYIGS